MKTKDLAQFLNPVGFFESYTHSFVALAFFTMIPSTIAIHYIDFTMKRFCRSPHCDDVMPVKYVAGKMRLNKLSLISRNAIRKTQAHFLKGKSLA